MYRKFYLILMALLLPISIFAQSGKLIGIVVDDQTGEPLVGANVLIEGTYQGAATDVDGVFFILNVAPGTYTLKGSYIGYADYVVQNIRVSVNLTTDVTFRMKSESYQTETIIIVAERPLVNKNITNSTNVIKAEDLEKLPLRTVNNIVAKEAGVVMKGGTIHVRGSRGDAVSYYVDGVLVNNPVFGGSRTSLISNAIEEIQFQAGGYSAEFGGANGGIISTQSKIGSEKHDFTVEVITDQFVSKGTKYLGGYSYGYNELVLTSGGPLIPSKRNLRYFVAANRVFQGSPVAFYRGIDLKGVSDPSPGSSGDEFDWFYPEGYRVEDEQTTYNIQGNVSWDLQPVIIKFSGTFRSSKGQNGVGYTTYNTADRAGINESQTITSSLKLTHVIDNKTYYDVIANYFNDFNVSHMDPVFRHNITAYGDSLENDAEGYFMRADGVSPRPIEVYGYSFAREAQPYNEYRKQRTESYGLRFNFLHQKDRHNELKAGFEANQYVIRRYALPSPRTIASLQRSVADGNVYDMYNRLDNYGYDVYGNPYDGSGLSAPRKPIFGGAYIQDKLEFKDLVIQAGVRFDYIDIDSKVFKDPSSVQFDADDEIDPNGLEDVEPYTYLSPRLGFSFPVTETTIFHAQYGKFVQQSRLRDVYQGYNVLSDNIKGGYAISQPVGMGLKPEQTTSYEIGFKQQLGEYFAFNLTVYYKDIKDQIQQRQIFADPNASHSRYYAWTNGDFATTKGFELKLDLRRTNRVTGSFDYTYSDAQGTGSNPSDSFRAIWQSPTDDPFFPMQIAPLDFNQTHRGFLNIDYRFAKNDGPTLLGSQILQQSGANMIFSFTSGFNYTRWDGYVDFDNGRIPLEPLNNSVTPWTYQVDLRLDKTFSLGAFDVNAYVWITNLFNTQNVVTVFNSSSDAYDDGFIASEKGQNKVQGYENYREGAGEQYAEFYRALHYNSGHFGPPRQVRVGLKIDL